MAREPEELAEMRRALGAQLATFRQAAELTQSQIAKAVFRDRTTVAHTESGRRPGDERFWRVADELCGAAGVLLAAFHAVEATKQEHEAWIRETQLSEARAKVAALRAAAVAPALPAEVDWSGASAGSNTVTRMPKTAVTVVGNPCPETVEDPAMRRREAIELAAKLTAGAGLSAADRAVLDTPARVSPVPARIGAPDVTRVEEMTRKLMDQDKAMGGGSCRDAVLGYLRWAQQLRDASASDSVQAALHAALARLESLAGWTSEDLWLLASAQRCYLRSLESARLAGQPLLAAHALGRLGELYLRAGHYREALRILRLGERPARDVASPGMLASFALGAAQAHAGLGDANEVQRAFRRAEGLYAHAREASDEWISTAVLPDHSDLPAGRANAYSGLAGHDLRFAEAAVVDMTEALTLRDPARVRAMLWGRITLAANQYRCGEIDLANTGTELVLTSVGQISSRRTTRDLTALGAVIRQYTTDSTAHDLAHRIHTLLYLNPTVCGSGSPLT
ncbi:MAG: helix-turn-helix domain-containing protein [Pseudonocardiaceae bacterium]